VSQADVVNGNAETVAHISPLAPADVDELAVLAAAIWRHHYPDIISPAQIEYMLAQRYDAAVLRAELERNDLWWDQLRVGGRMTGFASYFLAPAGEMKLDKLYVHQDLQRRGYGGMLLARALEVAREHGCSAMMLAVNKNNRNAIAAYRKHGFHIDRSVVKDIGGGFVMDDYLMVRKI
jgi:ribosomal protein S18 acetylase RimI-like enzyme